MRSIGFFVALLVCCLVFSGCKKEGMAKSNSEKKKEVDTSHSTPTNKALSASTGQHRTSKPSVSSAERRINNKGFRENIGGSKTSKGRRNSGDRNKNIGVRTIKFCGMEYKSDTTVVDCRDKTVTDLTPLMGLKRLKHLSLSETQVNDLTSLKGLKELENLWLSGTQVKEITPLKGLMKLKNLDLAKTKVIDLTPLKGLKKLKYLYLKKTEVTESQVNELKEALPNCSVAIP